MSTKVILKNVRLFFPDLFEPVQFDGQGEFRFGAVFGVAKDDKQIKVIEAAIEAEAKEAWKAKAGTMLAAMRNNANKFCFTDGDSKSYEGAEGVMLLSARRKAKDGRPYVVDRAKNLLAEKDGVIYSGCYVNASVEVWAQAKDYPGVRCTLLGVQFFADGDSFSGAAKPLPDDFEQLEEGADAADLA